MSTGPTYVVAGTKSWNRRLFDSDIVEYPGQWLYVDQRDQLSREMLCRISPRYVFFLHWSWKVPAEVYEMYECVCFHMTDVPYGRGGSPLQNLIARGHRETKLTALRMSGELDAGPVYLKLPLSLEGSAEEIYIRATRLASGMIRTIIQDEIQPTPQSGDPTYFARRKPEESRLPGLDTLQEVHDFIRMVDAEGYPKAFLDVGNLRIEFTRSGLYNGQVRAEASFRLLNE